MQLKNKGDCMRPKTIKNLIILFVGLFVTAASILPGIGGASPQTHTIQTDSVTLSVQSIEDTTTIHYSLGAFSTMSVMINGKQYQQIALGNEPSSLIAGAPDLPSISRSIIIPKDTTMSVRVIDSSYEEYTNILVAPSKGNLPRTINPADVPYEFGDIYSQDTWYPSSLAELQEPYYLRDFRGQVVTIHPFQYNPVDSTLRFYTDITVEVTPVASATRDGSSQQLLATVDSDFLPIYENHFINFNAAKYTPLAEQGSMLVITYDSFYDTMVPYVEWKNLKGIATTMVNVSEIGNAAAIKEYIKGIYESTGLTFVLLVGDAAQVPTLYASGGASDVSYGYITGNDHYPELFVGRFSAENIAQAQTQANRTITYERDPQIGAEWYKKGIGIGSEYGVGDDGEYDYQHIRNIRSLLMNFTYSYVDEFYGGTQGGLDLPGEPTTTMVANALNEGRSILNYCGHGSPTSWGTSGFSNSNVNTLTNDNMLPFMVSVACNNGEFDDTTCFGEAWLRATHNGQPTGAIGAYMSSISQSWDPPMEAQDEFNNILVGLYENNTRTTFGALCFESSMSMIDKYGADGIEMADTWIIFGDPSVQVRTAPPENLTVTHASYLDYGADTFEVDVPGVSGALCAISAEGRLLGNGYTDATGHAVIEFFSPVNATGEVQLVVTAFNAVPYMETLSVGQPNTPPEIPEKPSGKASGNAGTSYLYSTKTTDADGDGLYFMWDWGDGNFSEWLGPYASGAVAMAQKSWPAKGAYSVKVKAKDSRGAETDWSEPLDVTMPYHQTLFARLLTFLEKLFPNLFQFFENLLNV
jgi:hypothetical protein